MILKLPGGNGLRDQQPVGLGSVGLSSRWRRALNDAVNKITLSAERSADRFQASGRDLDARQALEYMGDTLGELANHEYTHRPSATPPPDLAADPSKASEFSQERVLASHEPMLVSEGESVQAPSNDDAGQQAFGSVHRVSPGWSLQGWPAYIATVSAGI